MKIGLSIKSEMLIGLGLISLIGSTGCINNQNAATALLPASPAGYPASEQAAGENQGTSLAATEVSTGDSEAANEERKPEPFVLREGETLIDHKVVSGDNLTQLSRRYGTSIRRIQSANGLTGDMILSGKVYKIPSTGDLGPAKPPKPPKPAAPAVVSAPPRPTPPPVVERAKPSAPSTFRSPSLDKTYSRTAPPTFAPRDIKYSNSTLAPSPGQTSAPAVISPTQSASSATISPPGTSGSGAALPSPTFGAGSQF